MARICILLVMAALIVGMVGCETPSIEIWDWYDLDAVRNNLGGHHTLMNDLDSTTLGYAELASPTANQGKGWQPIGTYLDEEQMPLTGFRGTLDGRGYEIRDLFINRPDEDDVGLFGFVYNDGVIKDIGAVNITVTGGNGVGGLVGFNHGTVSNCYCSANVTGNKTTGGLAGGSGGTGILRNCCFMGNVTGYDKVGGLAGSCSYGGTVTDCYSTGNVIGYDDVGGLVGDNAKGTVSNSYSTGRVSSDEDVGGLVGYLFMGDVLNSFWDIETSGQATSHGGTGKTTAEMQDITTFSGATWDITTVANPGTRNPSYIWNIVDDETYPFLSWQS